MGYVEALFRRFGVDLYQLETDAAPSDIFADGMVYKLQGSKAQVAVIGSVAPALLKQFGIRQSVFAAEIGWKELFELVKRNKISYKELPKGVTKSLRERNSMPSVLSFRIWRKPSPTTMWRG